MKIRIIKLYYWMLSVIGNIIIGLASIIKFLHSFLLGTIIMGIIGGIFCVTMIAFFGLLSEVINLYPEINNLFGKWYWCLIILILGGTTMVIGIKESFK